MTDAQRLDSTDAVPKLSHEALETAIKLGILIYCFAQAVISWAHELERQHHRAQLLVAYRRRHAWKKSDILHLRSLGVNQTAQRRMEQLTGTGRPVVKRPQPLDLTILKKANAVQTLFDPKAKPTERRQALKFSPWWPHHVEALYRGEHVRARSEGIPNPSVEAEILVGHALGISAAKVHVICGDIRCMRKEDPESANFPAMTVGEFDQWMETGVCEFPDCAPKIKGCLVSQ